GARHGTAAARLLVRDARGGLRRAPQAVGRGPAVSVLHASVVCRLSRDFTLDVALEVPPGITIVFGASGSGKSTLLRSIAGLINPDEGRIAIGDRVLFERVRL